MMAHAMLDQANFSMIQSQSRMEQEKKDMETLLSTFTESIGDQQDQNLSQDDNVVPKKKMKRRKDYSNTKVKTRNLLTFLIEGLNNQILIKLISSLIFCHF